MFAVDDTVKKREKSILYQTSDTLLPKTEMRLTATELGQVFCQHCIYNYHIVIKDAIERKYI